MRAQSIPPSVQSAHSIVKKVADDTRRVSSKSSMIYETHSGAAKPCFHNCVQSSVEMLWRNVSDHGRYRRYSGSIMLTSSLSAHDPEQTYTERRRRAKFRSAGGYLPPSRCYTFGRVQEGTDGRLLGSDSGPASEETMLGIRRREFITLLGGAAAAWPLAARAQRPSKVYRIGFLANDPTIPATAAGRAFAEGLRENGFVEGHNIAIERHFLEGRVEGALELARQLVRLDVDLIVTSGNSNHFAVKQATATIPIVMVNAQDPVTEGIVASLARPGGNITGVVQNISADLAGKRLQLFKDAVPHISRVAVLTQPNTAYNNAEWAVLQSAAELLGLSLYAVQARQGDEL